MVVQIKVAAVVVGEFLYTQVALALNGLQNCIYVHAN